MSFDLAAIIVVAAVAVALALTCYHLLGRLEMLERAVHGGLEPPSTRLSREQFERRFRTAHARSVLASEVGTGAVLVVGPEYPDSELARAVAHLSHSELFSVRTIDTIDGEALGVTTTPYLFIIDEEHVRAARPVVHADDVTEALGRFA